MTKISGEITSHLTALGAGTRDRSVFAILSKNPHFIEDEPVTDADGVARIDIVNIVEGLLLRFRDGELDTVSTMVRRQGDYYPFPRPQDLITGLDLAAAGREDVQELLGAPVDEASDHARYAVAGGVLTVTFEADQLASITVSRD